MTIKMAEEPRLNDWLSGTSADWEPETVRQSAWLAHVPFAFWIVAATRPRCLVEIGTHTGVSYFAFCQAVQQLNLAAQCFAVRSRSSGEPAESPIAEPADDVECVNEAQYSSFSTLLKIAGDQAATRFADNEVDLLHVDGLFTDEALAQDFAAWRAKLSKRCVVLLHGINLQTRNSPIGKLWTELSRDYPHFTFNHGRGLGVLGIGETIPVALEILSAAAKHGTTKQIRSHFAERGFAVQSKYQSICDQAVAPFAYQPSVNHECDIEQTKVRNAYVADRLQAGTEFATALKKALQRNEAQNKSIRDRYWLIRKPSLRKLADRFYLPSTGKSERVPHSSAGINPIKDRASTFGPRKAVWIGGEPDTPGYRYRVTHPCEAAGALGIDSMHMPASQTEARWHDVVDADVVVIWRTPWSQSIQRLVKEVHRRGGEVVFDIDDLIFEPALATSELIDSIRSQALDECGTAAMFERFRTTMLAADWCTAPTLELVNAMRALGKPAFELINGYDALTEEASRLAAHGEPARRSDSLVRVGYAAGTSTHQRDFAVCAKALARILLNYPMVCLVLFRDSGGNPYLDPLEFPELLLVQDRIEWRDRVQLAGMPHELARFDINLAPLQVGNPFCEAKSELKYFEAALANVCTIASPTGPYQRAIEHGQNGLLATDEKSWYEALARLIERPDERTLFASNAQRKIQRRFGPEQRQLALASLLGLSSHATSRLKSL